MTAFQLFLAGDSTMSDYPADDYPRMGWGQVLSDYFDDKVSICNHAASGRSTKSFIDEGRWEQITAVWQPGDYVFIQFGHNDQKPDVERATDPFTSYAANLRFFIEQARAAEVTPVLLTSIARRHFDDQGILQDTHGLYPEAMRQVAKLQQVMCLDMLKRSSQLLMKLGEQGSKSLFMQLAPGVYPNYPLGEQDDTHLTEKGAQAHSKLCIEELRLIHHPLAQYVKGNK
ncbi:rhamnogalacturonan acetylesterase [Gracilibacillus alcaliphilus]|uniref:rhamnogalacturonan acetylesterase n=1 Tax=Gracilibacillus alcaliphilus TaxID=1401441 RepID=UPI0019569DA1|nr:rhamnogalacturonan acetylesterase [Gracilibacillus alcaliphilus]MBM7679190.1 lysophospholipase L1-like esterase [Gracilibacillus alcaliphilus]